MAAALSLVAAETYAVEKITVVALFTGKAMVELDGKRRLLKRGQTSPEGVTLINATAKGATLEVNGERKLYPLGRQIGSKFKQAASARPVRISPSATGMYATSGTINGRSVKFLVDTGATVIAMNRNEARRLSLNFRVDGTRGQATTASGIVNTYNVRLRKVRVGQIELRDVDATVVDGDFPAEILLGNSFLNRVDMRREGRILELRPRKR